MFATPSRPCSWIDRISIADKCDSGASCRRAAPTRGSKFAATRPFAGTRPPWRDNVKAATEADWTTEYLDLVLAVA